MNYRYGIVGRSLCWSCTRRLVGEFGWAARKVSHPHEKLVGASDLQTTEDHITLPTNPGWNERLKVSMIAANASRASDWYVTNSAYWCRSGQGKNSNLCRADFRCEFCYDTYRRGYAIWNAFHPYCPSGLGTPKMPSLRRRRYFFLIAFAPGTSSLVYATL